MRLGLGTRRITSRDLEIVEVTEELLDTEVPEPNGVASNVSLLRGFNATIPSAQKSRSRRRQTRNVDTPRLGLKKLGMNARGMMAEADELGRDHEECSVASEDDVVVVGRAEYGQLQKGKGRQKGRESLSATKFLGQEELTRQRNEITRDKENLHVRRVCLGSSALNSLS
jgi:division protein 1